EMVKKQRRTSRDEAPKADNEKIIEDSAGIVFYAVKEIDDNLVELVR
ncbi:7893_t:CDS:2, partial [Scutellospora calospora]